MLTFFLIIGCKMYNKLHMVHSQLNEFKDNMPTQRNKENVFMDFKQRYQP